MVTMEAKRTRPGADAIKGNWATLLLPINADESIDVARLGAELDRLVAARVDGIYSNGTAGEFCNQTDAEFDTIQQMLAERCGAGDMAFVIGACQPDPTVSLARVRRAAALHPAAIQVILPDWVPVTEPEATIFLEMAAEAASDVPLILYHPPHAKRVFSPAQLREIVAPVSQVIGIKLGDGDAAWYGEARRAFPGLGIFVPGHHLATGIAQGVATGSFSNVACLNPLGAQHWTQLMATDIEAALAIEGRLRAFMEVEIAPFGRDQGYCNAALDKLLAAIGNWSPVGTRLRRPYRWIAPQIASDLRQRALRMLPEIMGPQW